MHSKTHGTVVLVTLGGLVCISALGAVALGSIVDLEATIRRSLQEDGTMQRLESTVTSATTGLVTTVVTTRGESESMDDFKARHVEACDAMKA